MDITAFLETRNYDLGFGSLFLYVTTFGVTIVKFEWDETKNRVNVRKHGFHFAEAEEMFHGALLTRPDMDQDYGEERWVGIGVTRSRIAVVAFAERQQDTIRIISLRKADNEERKQYEEALQDGLETSRRPPR